MNNNAIGILDSGIGGLSIWQELVFQLPFEATIYIADSKNCPYGTRSAEEVYSLAHRLVSFLVQQKVKLVVIACNTITVSCIDRLRTDFPDTPIVGIVPVVKAAAEKTKNGVIGILSTQATANSPYQQELINKFANTIQVINIGTDKLVPFVERDVTEGEQIEEVLKEELALFQQAGIDTLALGCSHFPFLRKAMKQVLGPDVLLLDSAGAVVRQVARILDHNTIRSEKAVPSYVFYTTGDITMLQAFLQKNLQQDKIQNATVEKLEL